MHKSKIRIAFAASGACSNAQSIIDAINSNFLYAEPLFVFTGEKNYSKVEKSLGGWMPSFCYDSLRGENEDQSSFIFRLCRLYKVDLLCLCGFLRLLVVPDDFQNRVLNIHPSLLPKFGGKGMYGMKVHQSVIDAGEKVSGCTVHYVNNQYDEGKRIVQKLCHIEDGETVESLKSKVFELDQQAYPQAIKMWHRLYENGLLAI